MSRFLFILVYTFLLSPVTGQRSYPQAIEQAKAAMDKKDYKTAISKYFAAEAFDPSQKKFVQLKVDSVFEKIEALRKEAEDARQQTLIEKNNADSNLRRAEKLNTAFYFYNDRFALTYGPLYKKKNYSNGRVTDSLVNDIENVFYFIDKNGDKVNLGEWDRAEPFDEITGFAKVKKKSVSKMGNRPSSIDKESMTIKKDNTDEYEEIGDTLIRHVKSVIEKGIEKDTGFISIRRRSKQNEFLRNDYFQSPAESSISHMTGMKVGNSFLQDYLIDTLGNKYIAAYDLRDIDNSTEALVLNLNEAFKSRDSLLFNAPYKYFLKILILDGSDFDKDYNTSHIVQVITRMRSLEYLQLIHFNIKYLPPLFFTLKKLKTLKIGARLDDLPPGIGNLTNLKTLVFGGNMTHLPNEIGNLRNLEILKIDAPLDSIPPGIWKLNNLMDLNLTLEKSSLTALPPELSHLTNLTNMTLAGMNNVSGLPGEIGKLTNLRSLDIAKETGFKTLPPEIGNLINLTNLSVIADSLPAEIGNLLNLQNLSATAKSFPNVMGELKDLKKLELYIDKDGLEKVLDWIDNLKELNELSVSLEQLKIKYDSEEKRDLETKIRKLLPNCEILFF